MKNLIANITLVLLCGASAAFAQGAGPDGKSGAGADEPGAGTGTGWNSAGPNETGSPRTPRKHASREDKNPGTTLASPSGNARSNDTSTGSRFTGSVKKKHTIVGGGASSKPSREESQPSR
ncbi:MAG: hypothetical protein JWL63_1998 [Rhodocyclales bacterium]|nr:hypothetical protein [Rhodocyclales bacterium]